MKTKACRKNKIDTSSYSSVPFNEEIKLLDDGLDDDSDSNVVYLFCGGHHACNKHGEQ